MDLYEQEVPFTIWGSCFKKQIIYIEYKQVPGYWYGLVNRDNILKYDILGCALYCNQPHFVIVKQILYRKDINFVIFSRLGNFGLTLGLKTSISGGFVWLIEIMLNKHPDKWKYKFAKKKQY